MFASEMILRMLNLFAAGRLEGYAGARSSVLGSAQGALKRSGDYNSSKKQWLSRWLSTIVAIMPLPAWRLVFCCGVCEPHEM